MKEPVMTSRFRFTHAFAIILVLLFSSVAFATGAKASWRGNNERANSWGQKAQSASVVTAGYTAAAPEARPVSSRSEAERPPFTVTRKFVMPAPVRTAQAVHFGGSYGPSRRAAIRRKGRAR
jgi:hypothetical protein